ncbi:glycoside hydrolase family 3 N-terminal domain-containing protein [Sphingomonas sp. MMS24-JH45]
MTPDRRTFLALAAGGLALPRLAAADTRRHRRPDRADDASGKGGQLSCYSDGLVRGRGVQSGRQRDHGRGAAGRDPGRAHRDALQRLWRRRRPPRAGGGAGEPVEDPADLRRRRHPRLPHHLPDPSGGGRRLRPRPVARCAARAVARETSAGGIHWTFAPMVDVCVGPAPGRVAEGAGEDPHLGALLAAARVRGFQGDDLRRPDALAATPKHFAGYAAVSGGMEYGSVDLSERALREVHLPPFAAAFAAGAAATMAAFTEVDDVPRHRQPPPADRPAKG